MLSIAFILIFTIVKIAYFAKTRHVDEMDWVLLRMPWLGYAYR